MSLSIIFRWSVFSVLTSLMWSYKFFILLILSPSKFQIVFTSVMSARSFIENSLRMSEFSSSLNLLSSSFSIEFNFNSALAKELMHALTVVILLSSSCLIFLSPIFFTSYSESYLSIFLNSWRSSLNCSLSCSRTLYCSCTFCFSPISLDLFSLTIPKSALMASTSSLLPWNDILLTWCLSLLTSSRKMCSSSLSRCADF